jgi:hypothetical protein
MRRVIMLCLMILTSDEVSEIIGKGHTIRAAYHPTGEAHSVAHDKVRRIYKIEKS